MKKHIKYLLLIVISISCISLFSNIFGRTEYLFTSSADILPQINDTAPRYPVKKTQIASYRDLEVNHPIDLQNPSNVKTSVEYDPVTNLYVFRTKMGDQEIATPFSMSSDEYMDYTLKQSMANYFKNKNAFSVDKKNGKEDFSLKDVKLNLGPAERLFGPGGVQVKTQGYVEATMGIKHSSIDNPTLAERNRSRTAFEFKQDIQMNVNATVGDKINFGLNYDTKALFDFDSQNIKLAYDASSAGDEDGILRRIEAGNVSMATTNSLVKGTTALFGITTELQFGKLHVNAVVSQQESQMQTADSKGGIQTTNFEFNADKYDQNRHFFLGHYFRDNYDRAMSTLPFVQSGVNITHIEVWITNKKGNFNQARNIVAFADMGENKVIKNPRWTSLGSFTNPYNRANNLYDELVRNYSGARNITQVTRVFDGVLTNGQDYEKLESARLLTSNEYIFDAKLGYVSLNTALQADEVLAVAYEYTLNGNTYQVGEFATDIVDQFSATNPRSGALFLRMLKPVDLAPAAYTWDLMMKNVYNLGASSIQKENFRLNIYYQSDTIGTYINYIPEGKINRELLLRVMNLDRLDFQNNPRPDGIFDYVDGYTIRSQNGRMYFPVVEPFGSYLGKKINDSAIAKKFVYQELYDLTAVIASQIAEKNKFKISGSYRSSASNSEINLNASNVPKGSVRVMANGMMLTEGSDYVVDYVSGTVNIINQSLLDNNTPIQVSMEDRTMSMQRRTLMGLNLSYDVSKKLTIGGTIMHLSEKPLTVKPQIGTESVNNTLWGLNTAYRTQSDWLTNLVNKIPNVNAKQPSQIAFNAEFAQMLPGHYQNKVTGSYSFIDDFESSETRIDIRNPFAWSLASTPWDDSSSPVLLDESRLVGLGKLENGNNRAMLSWFTIDGLFTRRNSSLTPQHIRNDVEQLSNHYVREINMRELYPNRDVPPTESATIPALNLSFYPDERGPYNVDLAINPENGKLLNPEKRWGGIMRKMDVRDFEAANIEYIDFWLMDPFVYNNVSATPNQGGDLYINLGEVSEDVLKDGRKFFENGLPINDDPDAVDLTVWGKVPKRQSTVYAFDDSQGPDARRKQDVGLNGLSTEEELTFPTYRDYVTAFRAKLTLDVQNRLDQDPFSPLRDPAGDNYRFFRGAALDQNQTSILDRYKYFNGTEGNSPRTEDSGETFSTAAKVNPDVEDIDQDNTLNERESYFQYKIQLRPDQMNIGQNYIVDSRTVRVPLRDGTQRDVTWYQFKVPVRQPDKKIGKINNFTSIRFMRMFMHNFKQTTFLRFGTLQLVRGDWRFYDQSINKDGLPSGPGTIDVLTVNIEENANRTPINYVIPPGVDRNPDPEQIQLLRDNEQALALRVKDIEAGDARAVYKNTLFDLRRHKRLQMFTHAEQIVDNIPLAKGDLTVFIRLGTDYRNNFYEYEIPLTITPARQYGNSLEEKLLVWPKDNMFDFPLEVLKNLKLNRNREKRKAGSSVSYTSLYSEYDPEKPQNKISIIGNPSLAEVSVIMVGVRNNSRTVKSGEVWINELRLTDFDEEGGWAAQGNLNVTLSDLGNITLAGRKETVGFGSLEQTLLQRRLDDYHMYNIATTLDLGRFIPEKAKISIPFNYTYSNQTTTPKYDPFDQDVTLKESLSLMDTKAEKDSIRGIAEEKTTIKSLGLNNVKVNIQSKTPMPYDPANFTLNYVYSQTDVNTPTLVYDINKNYKGGLNYTYSPIMKTWEPFKDNKSKSGAAKFAKSIGINYLPSNITLNTTMTRIYTETLIRDIESYRIGSDNSSHFLTFSHFFMWDRDLSINWDLTRNLRLSFQSGTRAEIEEPHVQVNRRLNRDAYEEWKEGVIRSIKSLGDPLAYKQVARATYQLPFKSIPVLDWITSNASYTSSYQWDRGAEIVSSEDSVKNLEIGNTISNSIALETQNRLNLTNLYNKSSYLKKINDRFDPRRRAQSPSQRQQAAQKKEKPQARKFSQSVTLKKDTTITLSHNLNSKDLQISASKDGKPYALKFKKVDNNSIKITNKDDADIEINIQSRIKRDDGDQKSLGEDLAEYALRGLMSVRTISFNYTKRQDTHISGFRPGIGDAFGQMNTDLGMSPGLGFAFGLEGGQDYINRAMENKWLIDNQENINPAIFNDADKLEIRAQLEPIRGLKVELTANRETNKRTEVQFMFEGAPRIYGGNFLMTTIAIGSSLKRSSAKDNYYSPVFEKFLENRTIIQNRLEAKYSKTEYPNNGFLNGSSINGVYNPKNGAVNPNSADVLIPAFIAAYTGKDPDNVGLSPFPTLFSLLPNWNVSYEGLINVPFFRDRFKSIRLNHAYTALYQVNSFTSFNSWIPAVGGDGDSDLGFIRDVLTGNPNPSSPFNIGSTSISEMFNPLFGAEGVLTNNMAVNAQYNNGRMLVLNMSSYQVIETLQNEFIFGLGYRINEFNKILGVRTRANNFNNDLNIKADISYKQSQALLRRIEERFTQATSGVTVVTLRLTADYTFSRSLTLRAFLDRMMNRPLITSTSYPTTNSNFGISLKFTLVQ